jgi:hypothetical protein
MALNKIDFKPTDYSQEHEQNVNLNSKSIITIRAPYIDPNMESIDIKPDEEEYNEARRISIEKLKNINGENDDEDDHESDSESEDDDEEENDEAESQDENEDDTESDEESNEDEDDNGDKLEKFVFNLKYLE